MTFSALSFYSWYRSYRRHIKEMIENDDFSGARAMLENLVAEHQTNFPNDHSVMHSELEHLQHALKHIVGGKTKHGTNASSPLESKLRLTRILSYEPQQVTE